MIKTHLTAIFRSLVRSGLRRGAHPPQAARDAASERKIAAFGGAYPPSGGRIGPMRWVFITETWYQLLSTAGWRAISGDLAPAASSFVVVLPRAPGGRRSGGVTMPPETTILSPSSTVMVRAVT